MFRLLMIIGLSLITRDFIFSLLLKMYLFYQYAHRTLPSVLKLPFFTFKFSH